MHTKQFYQDKGEHAFESGHRIVCFNTSTWQSREFKNGYELAKAWSLLECDDPNEYQINKLKAVIKNQVK